MLRVRADLEIPEGELDEQFVRSGGPGGQNVNKVASKVVLRFSVRASACLSDSQRGRLLARLGSRLNAEGELVIHASRHRDQARNRADARERLAELLRDGLKQGRRRRATRPTRGSVERRLAAKKRRSETKRRRRGDDG